MAYEYLHLDFTETFLLTYTSRDFAPLDRAAILKALRFLDENERHPSLGVHKLEGDRSGAWSASASEPLRLTSSDLKAAASVFDVFETQRRVSRPP
ncbi:MAG TPA: hypothetical protein VG815_04565 [Chloroflexota bacterium]|jgi:hypothetical protein|nr:hypothetical protein [Chloroflexota bacterium]